MKKLCIALLIPLICTGFLTVCSDNVTAAQNMKIDDNMPVLDNPISQKAFEYFFEISKIPRGSHNEKEISDYLVTFAEDKNLWVVQDDALNVFIKKSGSKGRENEPPVILQAHMDMVCEKNGDVDHDFFKDPIIPVIEGDWLRTDGTTLGADNASGLALIMAILDSNELSHPPIEAIITTNEEDGMTGASAFDVSLFEGKRFINVDSEEEYVFTVSCAGSTYTDCLFQVEYTDVPKGFSAYTLSIKGLLGGHSGLDINKGRANANILMGKLLDTLSNDKFQVSAINGGSMKNAIPRECNASVLFNEKDYKTIMAVAAEMEEAFKSEFPVEENLTVTIEKIQNQKKALARESLQAVLECISDTPNGVLAMSPDIPNLVQTSNNLGVIVTDGNMVTLTSFSRSSVSSELDATAKEIRGLAVRLGADANSETSNAPWEYKVDSPLRDIMVDVFKEIYGKEPSIEAIHAGLECGAFGDRMPDCDFISIGPDITGAHSPDEKMSISSYDRTCGYLVKLLERI